MLNTNIDQSSKAFMRDLVRPIHSIKNAYKYLTFESGKLMLEKHNIQFTRASRLNDWLDCNIDIVNYDEVIALYGTIISRDEFERIKKEGKEFADSLGICSLGHPPHIIKNFGNVMLVLQRELKMAFVSNLIFSI